MPHTVKAYDDELKKLAGDLLRMGGLAESQLGAAIQALTKRDDALADAVIAGDGEIDRIEHEVELLATRLLALRQPVASDLRLIVGAIKLASEIERVGDYAKNVAKRAKVLNAGQPLKPAAAVPRMAGLVQALFRDALDAFARRDAEKAVDVWKRDGEIDDMYNSIFRELLTYMIEDARAITSGIHLLFIVKNLERMGDHATNMAEMAYFIVTGARLDEARPKGDTGAIFRPPS
ncbi:MAG: phosphate signaling complex protein PhoU [Alphaproteobacteria bacterium]|nr:phosphate signaling complex protein PhoU [Alphaproteobacteria bacterium]